MLTIYTYGYGGNGPAELERFVMALGATVVDVRLTPWSKRPEWQGAALKARFGSRYSQGRTLGNPNYRDDREIQPANAATRADDLLWGAYQAHGWLLADPARGLAQVRPLASRTAIILLCGCQTAAHCHRSLVAAYLGRELRTLVEHLPGRFVAWQYALPMDSAEVRL